MRIGICLNYQNVAWHTIEFVFGGFNDVGILPKIHELNLGRFKWWPTIFPLNLVGEGLRFTPKVSLLEYLPAYFSRNKFASAKVLTQLALAAATRNLLFSLI